MLPSRLKYYYWYYYQTRYPTCLAATIVRAKYRQMRVPADATPPAA
jgi:hypothetical protein